MLATLSEPTSGTATVCGHDVVREADAVRRAISLTGQFAALEDNLTDRENLLLMARLRGYGKAAAGLVVQPQLLVLDEPTTGLDPRSRQVVWSTVRDLVDDGVTVLLTTQYLEEADALADDIVLIDHGQTVAAGSPSDLKARVATSTDFSSGVVDRFRSLPVTRMSVISAQVIGQIIEQILGIAIVAGVGLALGCRCRSWPARSCRSPA